MMIGIIAYAIHTIGYILLVNFVWNRRKEKLFNVFSVLIMIGITVFQAVAVYVDNIGIRTMLPVCIMGIVLIYGLVLHENMSMYVMLRGIMGAYIFAMFANFLIGASIGAVAVGLGIENSFESKLIISCVIRAFLVILIWLKYNDLVLKVRINTINIMIFVGSFVLFFQQLFQTAYIEKDYNLGAVLLLLVYLTMIFTAFMLLQHNRLTAKQQAIEEDNRQMSQRLHRSKDVLGVVSQVVASDDHIDPKLRKELADFCDDEMNEMQDRTMGANLIGDTGIELVNVMLQKQMMRCADLNISFDVMIPSPIDGYIDHIGISVTEFMRMLNDLLKNAVKAIVSSQQTHRELLLIMGDAGNDYFEIRLYDSGVPFPPEILEHFGERGNTTDGTGNGIADTVATLSRYHASLAIESIEPGTDIYRKCIHIAFDQQGCFPCDVGLRVPR